MREKPKNNFPIIANTGEADSVLKRIAQLTRKLNEIHCEAEARAEKVRQFYATKSVPLFDEVERLGISLSIFSETYKDKLFIDKKTLELNFGYIGFRQSTKITITRQTLKLLKQMGFTDAIITKETPNKEVLATYPEKKLAEVKAKKQVADEFWYAIRDDIIQ